MKMTPIKTISSIIFYFALANLFTLSLGEAHETLAPSVDHTPHGNNDCSIYSKQSNKSMGNTLKIIIGSETFTARLVCNATSAAFKKLLPITLIMKDVNGNEKYFRLPRSLPIEAANPEIIYEGDLMLWGSDGLALFYKKFSTSYSYTPVGRVDDSSGLSAALGRGDVSVTFCLE